MREESESRAQRRDPHVTLIRPRVRRYIKDLVDIFCSCMPIGNRAWNDTTATYLLLSCGAIVSQTERVYSLCRLRSLRPRPRTLTRNQTAIRSPALPFNGLHPRNFYPFTDPEGWKAEYSVDYLGHYKKLLIIWLIDWFDLHITVYTVDSCKYSAHVGHIWYILLTTNLILVLRPVQNVRRD